MKLSKVTTAGKPFHKDVKLQLDTTYTDHRIRGFTATYKGVKKEFTVKDDNILAAWQQLERWLEKQK